MSLGDITYLSIVPNKSQKKYQDIDSIIKIGNNSSDKLNFGKKIIYTYQKPTIDSGDFEIKIIDEIPHNEFNDFVLQNYSKLFDTDYAINFHSDGFIQNQEAWDDIFLEYDYIGAPIVIRMSEKEYLPLVGNGGFSLRSKKICEKIKELKSSDYLPQYLDAWGDMLITKDLFKILPTFFKNEDLYIGLFCNKILKEKGFKISDLKTASLFSTEHFSLLNNISSNSLEDMACSFGFHEINALRTPAVSEYRKRIQEKMTQ